MRTQRLVGEPFETAPEAVRHLVAVQSQDYPGAKWALGQRVAGATETSLDDVFDAGTIIRTHVLRPTWHFVDPADLRWLLALTGPRVHQANAYQYRQMGIDREIAARARGVIERALAGGRALTREELGLTLSANGIPAAGIRLGALLMDAELEALVCSGPRRGKRHTYALVDERVPPAPERTRDEALAELATRYVAGHGPAQVADLAWWSGLTVADSRRALAAAEPALRRESVGDRTFWTADEPLPHREPEPGHVPTGDPAVHLLPNYDELLIAFRDRTDAMDPGLPAPARVAQVILAHIVVRDGLGVGGWRRSGAGAALKIAIDLLVPLDDRELGALRAQVERLSAFLGRKVEATGLD